MNIETNSVGSSDKGGAVGWIGQSFTRLLGRDIQSDINARGYIKHDESVRKLLSSLEYKIRKNLENNTQDRSLDLIWYLMRQVRNRREEKASEIDRLNRHIQEVEESLGLTKRYALLAGLQQDYIDHEIDNLPQEEKNDFEDKFRAVKNEIDQDERNLGELHRKVFDLMKSQYFADDEWTRKLEANLVRRMNWALSTGDPDSDLFKSVDEYRDVLKLYSDNKKLIFTDRYKTWKYKLDSPRNFSLLNNKIATNLFHCKSAEDRTGRVNDAIEQAIIFKDNYGFFPSSEGMDEEDSLNEAIHAEYAASIGEKVFYLSASRDTNSWNNPGARGLKIDLVEKVNSPSDVIRANEIMRWLN